MASNVFKSYQDFVQKNPRNSFDESWRNYLTLKFGYLTPCFVQDVTNGDSMSLQTAFALNFMPTVFPLQTPIRVSVYFFYVRYRNLWKGWKDFRWNNKALVHPYIHNENPDFYATGSLSDYLGVPSTIASGSNVWLEHHFVGKKVERFSNLPFARFSSPSEVATAGTTETFSCVSQTIGTGGQIGVRSIERVTLFTAQMGVDASKWDIIGNIDYLPFSANNAIAICCDESQTVPLAPLDEGGSVTFTIFASKDFSGGVRTGVVMCFYQPGHNFPDSTDENFAFVESHSVAYDATQRVMTIEMQENFIDVWNNALAEHPGFKIAIVFRQMKDYNRNVDFISGSTAFCHRSAEPIDISRLGHMNPFLNSEDGGQRLNALPFRAYEQIYNSFFRNERVEPFVKNGEVQYNDFLTTDADGPDSTSYELKKRNWEFDFLTSALPSPQQGAAPIVGVDTRHITFQDGDREVHYTFERNSDGTMAPGRFVEEDVSGNVRQTAMDLVASGFSINDFRNANAMQIYEEKNYRRGLRYDEQHYSHTGVKLDYAELDMPEFIGGVSEFVKAEQITNMAAGAAPLGDYAGQLSAFGEVRHKINHYFREDGLVLGLMCVVPQPAYSQILPKMFTRTSALDYYNYEFSHLGMQPIPMVEVAPLQTYAAMKAGATDKNLQSTFGYQRPNYDMVARVDEVHGQMRTTMRNFVMNRTFTDVPELGAEFLHVDPKQLNQVFQFTNEGEDTCFGQVAFKCFMKRPVPRVGEPRLEA